MTIRLPALHPGQTIVEREAKRFNALVCGRRWGKSKYLIRRMSLRALRGEFYGYFAPTYKYLADVFREADSKLSVIPGARVDRQEKRIALPTGGVIEFWTMTDEDAGRSRKYHEVGIDEAGLVPNLEDRWMKAIRATLADYKGEAWFAGTPKGRSFFETAYSRGQDPAAEAWASWQMPTRSNPYIDPEEVEAARQEMPERAFRQEYLAEFLDEGGGVFRGVREVVMTGLGHAEATGPCFMGVDLARVEDFTVITVLDERGKQCYHERFNQISWERQVERICDVFTQFKSPRVFIDSTGVGDPIYERLRKLGLSITPYHFSNSSKEALIDNLAMIIERKDIKLLDIPVQTEELLAFQYELTPSRNVRMSAPEGMHDDCVISLALAAWGLRDQRSTASRPRDRRGFGFV